MHIQFNWWQKGVSGSVKVLRIPLIILSNFILSGIWKLKRDYKKLFSFQAI
jgi:hypothetical protein